MLIKLNQWLIRNSKGWLILLLLGLFLLFSLWIMPNGQKWLGGTAPQVGSIDLTFAAKPLSLFDKVEAYGDQGRVIYRLFELSADIAYPVIYSLFLSLGITWLFRRTLRLESRLQKLNLLPFFSALLDLCENLGIVGLLSTYPRQYTALAVFTIVANTAKWILVAASLLLLFGGLIGWIIKHQEINQNIDHCSE